jgi:hypothetical protein
VVIEDTNHALAIAEAGDHEMDVVGMFLERANNQLTARKRHGVVVVDRPTGGRSEETRYLVRCLESLQTGTRFVKPDRIAINVLTTASELVRLLKLADVVVSCSVAYAFSRVFDFMTLVADSHHLLVAERIVPEWWGHH